MSQNNEINQIINQAKSEARSEKIAKFFSKNSKTIFSILVFAVVVLVIYFVFNLYKNSQEEKYSEILQLSIIDEQTGNINKAKEALKNIAGNKSVPSGVKSIASLRYAAILLNEGKKSEALDIYKTLSNCSSCDSYIKDLGGLLMIKILVADEVESQKPELLEIISEIENKSSELKYEIIEQKAIAEMQKNEFEKAYASFNSIVNNPEVSRNLKERAKEGLSIVVSKGYRPK
ncbi:MAG: hypothetical protein FJ368_02075 [Pelagibacterales bacterium]|nr:hypothetical protein [Pelagibacterales bacterium]